MNQSRYLTIVATILSFISSKKQGYVCPMWALDEGGEGICEERDL